MKNCCESYLIVVNAVQTEIVAGSSSQPDVDMVQSETNLSGSTYALPRYADIFEPPAGLPPDRGIEHVIPLIPDAQPVPQHMFCFAPAELTEVKAQVTDLQEQGMNEPSTLAYGSPILFVKKKTGELRMVVDYRALSKIDGKEPVSSP